jgi:hypothetical protein
LCPYPTPVTQVTLTSAPAGAIVVIDPTGQVWAYAFQLGSWVVLHAHCDQVTAYGEDLLCSTGVTRRYIYDYAGSQFGTAGTTWTFQQYVADPIVQIVSSSDNSQTYGWVQAGELELWGNQRDAYEGTEFASFATTYDGWQSRYESLQPLREYWYDESNGYVYYWNDTGPVGRLVSGKYIYGTSCSSMTSTCATF